MALATCCQVLPCGNGGSLVAVAVAAVVELPPAAGLLPAALVVVAGSVAVVAGVTDLGLIVAGVPVQCRTRRAAMCRGKRHFGGW